MVDTTLNIDLIKQFSSNLVKKKVGIVEFCESDEFCNKPLFPRQRALLKLIWLEELNGYEEDVLTEWIQSSKDGGEVTIAPKIRERVEYLRERNYDHFTQIQMVMGRRSGKGYMTGATIAKKLYDMIQLDDPQKHFEVAKGEHIYCTIVADSQDQAKKYQFKDAKNWILDCEPMQEYAGKPLAESISVYTPADLRRVQALRDKRVNVDASLASLRVEAFAKNARTIRGNASIMLIFDEMAHITPGDSHISDEELYKAAEPSLNQFLNYAMLFANSSPAMKTGKFFKLYEQVQELDEETGDPLYHSMFMIQAPSWEMFKDYEKDPNRRFSHSLQVSPDWDDKIPGVVEMRNKERANPDSFRVEYRAQFAEVQNAFLNPQNVDRMFDPDFTMQNIGRYLQPQHAGTVQYAYKAHGDPSSTGANFGFAVAHVEYVDEINAETGQIKSQVPHAVFDLIEAFYPDDFKDHTIDWLEVLPVFVEYINGFRPFEFSFDQFNSMAPIQMLQAEADRMGAWETQIVYKPAYAALNRTRAYNFKTALNLGRVHAPHPATNPKARNSIDLGKTELKYLVEKNGRIEKQDIGPVQTKDIADCIMECVDALIGQSLMSEYDVLTQPGQYGAQGGYSIGGNTGEGPFDSFYEKGHMSPHNPARGFNPNRKAAGRGRW